MRRIKISLVFLLCASFIVIWRCRTTQSVDIADNAPPLSSTTTWSNELNVVGQDSESNVWTEAEASNTNSSLISVIQHLPLHDEDPIAALYLAHNETDDPVSKRQIRQRIVRDFPADQIFNFIVHTRHKSSSDDELLYLNSLLLMTDVSDIMVTVEEVARTTQDEDFFVSLIYAIRETHTEDGLASLIRIAESSDISKKYRSSGGNAEPIVALHRCIADLSKSIHSSKFSGQSE